MLAERTKPGCGTVNGCGTVSRPCHAVDRRSPAPPLRGDLRSARVRGQETRAQLARRGLTLVELLVVIVILTMVTAATIPLMAPVTGQRKVRESARLVAALLAQAQSRAISSGRPVGVWIERLWTRDATDDRANHAIDLFLCQSPPPYSGATPDARATVAKSGASWVVEMQIIPQGWVQRGDEIRFNYRGPTYRILGVGPNVNTQPTHPDGSLTGSNMEIQVPPPPYAQPPMGAEVSYQIFRQPVKTADEPVTLPAGAMVDLGFSGIGNGTEFGIATPGNPATKYAQQNPSAVTGVPNVAGAAKPVLVMFGPSGKLASVHYAHRPATSSQPVFVGVKSITPVYLLVGQPPNAGTTAPPNFMNQENIWVAVNSQSGLITTGEVAIGSDLFAAGALTYSDFQNAIVASRAFARSQQNMGGR
jgi:type II secretion system protein H